MSKARRGEGIRFAELSVPPSYPALPVLNQKSAGLICESVARVKRIGVKWKGYRRAHVG